jgi:hypothetical protein
VDPSQLKTAEFIYLISEYAGELERCVVAHIALTTSGNGDSDVTGYIALLAKIYNAARNAKLEQSQPVIAQLENHTT